MARSVALFSALFCPTTRTMSFGVNAMEEPLLKVSAKMLAVGCRVFGIVMVVLVQHAPDLECLRICHW